MRISFCFVLIFISFNRLQNWAIFKILNTLQYNGMSSHQAAKKLFSTQTQQKRIHWNLFKFSVLFQYHQTDLSHRPFSRQKKFLYISCVLLQFTFALHLIIYQSNLNANEEDLLDWEKVSLLLVCMKFCLKNEVMKKILTVDCRHMTECQLIQWCYCTICRLFEKLWKWWKTFDFFQLHIGLIWASFHENFRPKTYL